MAQVFLSYDREDGAKARAIAQALELAGHFVWFDLHIKGGAEYGREIERALEQSDAVVVLWSERSVDSAWVRDEAAAGRDKNCLIPVLIEPVNPPMGFRQYQNLDFCGWKGRGKPPHMADLLGSIEALSSPKEARPAPSIPRRKASPEPKPASRKWIMIGGAILAGLVAIGLFVGLVLNDRPGFGGVQTVAVTAADSAAGPLARDLLVKLSALQGAKSGSMRLLGQGNNVAEADLVFETASNADREQLGASLVLLSGGDREIIWSKDFEQPSGKLADLKQQMAFTAAQVLSCALEGTNSDRRSLDRQTLKLYLNACAQLAGQGESRFLVRDFVKVTEMAPRFAPGWAGLLIAQSGATQYANMGAVDAASFETLKRYIDSARKHHPRLPEIKLAESILLPTNAFGDVMRLLDEAKRDSPDNPSVLSYRSGWLRSVGRMRESIDDARRSLELDPLSPYTLNSYISALAYAGQVEAARAQLESAERLWPGTAALVDIQFRYHLRFGDPQEAMRLGPQFGIERGGQLFLQARVKPTAANIAELKDYTLKLARADSRTLSFATQALGHFNLNDDLFRLILPIEESEPLAAIADIWFRPSLAGFRRDPRFILVMNRAGLVDYWRKSGQWPDFCLEPDHPYDCKAEAAKLARPA